MIGEDEFDVEEDYLQEEEEEEKEKDEEKEKSKTTIKWKESF